MKNVLTVDLEDWFSVEALNTYLDKDGWGELESVVQRNTTTILRLFAERKITATFFVLGWIADRYPDLVSRVASAGHEIACHSFYHRMVSSLTPEEFKKDTELAINAIIKACGQIPQGYRSPSWGMRRDMLWAYEIMAEFGFEYDSSIFPIHHDIYGDPGSPRRAHEITLPSGKTIIEVPASTITLFGGRFPVGGGGWLRQFPYRFTRWGIKRINREGVPAIIYFHPWELDNSIPRVKMDIKNRIRQYGNLNTMQTKVERLLGDFDFIPMKSYIDSMRMTR